MHEQTFYYNFKGNALLFILNTLLTVFLICGFEFAFLSHDFALSGSAAILCMLVWIFWIWKNILPHKAVVIDDEGIRIDHCQKLKWKDIDYAEYKTVRCCFINRKIISLVPKADADIKLNLMQKGQNPFPPFSIPLYGILRKEDEEAIIKAVTSNLSEAIK